MIGIIVPTHNRRERVETLVKEFRNDEIVGVIVNSCPTIIPNLEGSNWHLINVEPSYFWSASVNCGFIYLKSLNIDFTYIVLLNDDLHITCNDLLRLVALNNGRQICAPLILDFNDTRKVVFSGKSWSNRTLSYVETYSEINEIPDCNSVDILAGNCLAIPFNVLAGKTSLVNEFYFPHVFGDASFCIDMKNEWNLNSVVLKEVIAYDDTSDKDGNNYFIQGLELRLIPHLMLVFSSIKSGLYVPSFYRFKIGYSPSVVLGLISFTVILVCRYYINV